MLLKLAVPHRMPHRAAASHANAPCSKPAMPVLALVSCQGSLPPPPALGCCAAPADFGTSMRLPGPFLLPPPLPPFLAAVTVSGQWLGRAGRGAVAGRKGAPTRNGPATKGGDGREWAGAASCWGGSRDASSCGSEAGSVAPLGAARRRPTPVAQLPALTLQLGRDAALHGLQC